MSLPRRFLPSMSLLRAFETAARTESFTAAAAELNLTQGAVSRQIRALEETLGADLFYRERQKARLTLAGETYAREIREALRRISTATLEFKANPHGGSLSLAVLPTFGVRWMAPRLPDFLAKNAGIAINLETRLEQADFRFDSVDAAIHYGNGEWPGARTMHLMHEVVIPACSPALRAAHGFAQPIDIARAPLLHLNTRPNAWEKWFAAHNAMVGPVHGMLVDRFALAAQAASSGLGVALLPRFLIEPELERGELVPALDLPMVSDGAYYLGWPPALDTYPPLVAFRQWIGAVAAIGAGAPDGVP